MQRYNQKRVLKPSLPGSGGPGSQPLVDELVKENYSFDVYDLIGPGITHEKIFLFLVMLAIVLGLRWRRGG
jgi:hypothetical protein